ncbi:zinc finger protein GAI-ASSOCIATED FACTOR 1-like [Cocos nucifera]|uniref:Protein EARLY HEADING DATE 2 n=1 Tax=Cocos nucifera TaxID=13894 RepID=A0A8K0IXQ9_COCNU|nr:zinc finger protein GAI-ASSOCIATED FACTOR 1-like [Cocos nucifera]
MSNTSGEESQNTPHQQLQMGDPDAEVIAISPRTLLATNRYICEVCHKGFQRDQNLQLHRRGHNLPWKLKQRSSAEVKKRVYVCPEVSCTHHDPSRALGDLTGIKKHFSRKHGEKKWKCDKCSKRYAVQSDWKAHSKICGTKEYRCDCGTIFSRKDSFVTHRAFCDALTEENYRINHGLAAMVGSLHSQSQDMFSHSMPSSTTDTITNPSNISDQNSNINPLRSLSLNPLIPGSPDMPFNRSSARTSCLQLSGSGSSSHHMSMGSSFMSATALLQKAAEMGAKVSDDSISPILLRGFTGYSATSRASVGSRKEPFSAHGDASSSQCPDSSIATSAVPNLQGLMSTTSGGSFVENQSALQANSKWTTSDFRPTAFPQGGLVNLSLPMRAENQNSMVVLEGQMQQNTCDGIAEDREVRMTQDFLGLGPLGEVGFGHPSYDEGAVALNYSDGQQPSGHEIYPYHQISDSSNALEKPAWDF